VQYHAMYILTNKSNQVSVTKKIICTINLVNIVIGGGKHIYLRQIMSTYLLLLFEIVGKIACTYFFVTLNCSVWLMYFTVKLRTHLLFQT
jgi:hypothetical protein